MDGNNVAKVFCSSSDREILINLKQMEEREVIVNRRASQQFPWKPSLRNESNSEVSGMLTQEIWSKNLDRQNPTPYKLTADKSFPFTESLFINRRFASAWKTRLTDIAFVFMKANNEKMIWSNSHCWILEQRTRKHQARIASHGCRATYCPVQPTTSLVPGQKIQLSSVSIALDLDLKKYSYSLWAKPLNTRPVLMKWRIQWTCNHNVRSLATLSLECE